MNATKTKYKKVNFKSKYEADIARKFDAMGIEWKYEPFRIPWQPTVRYYTPDFAIKMPDGTEMLIECKGFFDPSARSKMAQVKAQHPDLDIRFIFMDETKVLSRKTKARTTYRDWAIKHGYKVCTTDTLAK